MKMLLAYKLSRNLGVICLIIGAIFRIQHWPFSLALLFFAFVFLLFSFIAQILIARDEDLGLGMLSYLFIGLMCFLALKLSEVEKTWYIIALIVPGLVFILKKSGIIKKPENFEEPYLPYNGISILALIILAIGLVFRYLHYPGFTAFLGVAALVQIFRLIRKSSSQQENQDWDEVLDQNQVEDTKK